MNGFEFHLKHTIIGPWLGVGACWKISSDSSSVVVSCLGAFPAIPPPISAGSGGLGGAFASSELNYKLLLIYRYVMVSEYYMFSVSYHYHGSLI